MALNRIYHVFFLNIYSIYIYHDIYLYIYNYIYTYTIKHLDVDIDEKNLDR